jgi:molybdopterin converting factor subunit 1
VISVKIKLFAALRDLIGNDEKLLLLPKESRSSAVLDMLAVEFPQLNEWRPHLRVAVNWEYVSLDHILRDNDEIALIPPVSGG